MSSEQKLKCFKCGKFPGTDNIKLFRFPKPGVRNLIRCMLWAKYLFPAEEQHLTIEFQTKLYNEHRMLCEDHFRDEDFTDTSKSRLLYTAVPSDTEQVTTLPAYSEETSNENRGQHATTQPQASSSSSQIVQPLLNITNTSTEKEADTSGMDETQKIQKENILQHAISQPQASTSQISNAGTSAPEETKTNQEKKLLMKCFKYMRSLCNMRNRMKNREKKDILNELSDSNTVKKLSKKLTPAFACLLQGQIRNSNKSTGCRWTKEEKIIALKLFKRSPTCYRLLGKLFKLPSPGTLKALLNTMPITVGIYQPVLKVLKNFVKLQPRSDNEFILMFDEMALKKHFEYNKKEDQIDGYQDHGTQERSPVVASHALVFMIAGIRKEVKLPIAHYFSSSFTTADRLAVLIKEILYNCFEAGIKISATVCDMDGVNRRALSILGATVERPYISVHNNEIVTLFDTSHLLKRFHNLFMKYNIECDTNISSDGKTGRGVAKWAHLKEFHNLDQMNQNFVFAPALTKDHLNPNQKPKMRVKLAAEVFSHPVAAGLYAKISYGTLSADAAVTASVVANVDKLFNSLNSESVHLRQRKKRATNMTEKTPHSQLIEKMKSFFITLKFVGCPRKPPSQEGWIWTLNGVERLFKNLNEAHNVRRLATRRLQLDPLKKLFECIRRSYGSNTNPTTSQFTAGIKMAIISYLARIETTGNC